MAVKRMEKSEVLAELARELSVRRQVYPRWIKEERISKRVAAKRIEALVRAMEIIEQADNRQFNLFE